MIAFIPKKNRFCIRVDKFVNVLLHTPNNKSLYVFAL